MSRLYIDCNAKSAPSLACAGHGVAAVPNLIAFTLSAAVNVSKFNARIGPLSNADKQLLWKKESFLSKFLSISPYTCLKKAVSGMKTGVLNGPLFENPTTNRVWFAGILTT